MLDSDASFFLVPEFQSSRGARRNSSAPLSDLRFGAVSGAELCMCLMPDPGTLGVAAFANLTPATANAVPTSEIDIDLLEGPAPDGNASITGTVDDHAADSFALHEDDPNAFPTDLDPFATESHDIRAVTPRRPMRFTFAREAVEHSRLILPIPNLFESAFEDDSLDGPGIDPRLQRSRARARARLAAHEAALPPEARNLWFDDGSELPAPDAVVQAAPDTETITITMSETCASDGSDGHAPRRAVRHLSVTRRTPKPHRALAEIHDPLQDHLHQVREALYTPSPEEETTVLAAVPQPALLLRISASVSAALMGLALLFMQITTQLQIAVFSQTRLLRTASLSGNLRLASRAMAITGLIFAVAQTIPANLM